MQNITHSDHATQTERTMKTELSDVIELQLAPIGAVATAPRNGASHPYQAGVEVCMAAGFSPRELAYHRYQLLVNSGLNAAAGIALHPAGDRPVSVRRDRLVTRWQKFLGEWILSPLFLLSSLAIIFLLPEKLVKKITAPFTDVNFWENFGKRVFDLICAISGFIFSSIFFIVVPLLIKLDSKGSVFYGQERAGTNNRRRDRRQVNIVVAHDRRNGERRRRDIFGRPFTVYKFRTMRADAEKHSGAVWAQKNDPRTTKVGRILRFIHIDEIPQFFNVLCGDMSMVGPRPERPQIMANLVKEIPDFPERLKVKPGITGIAQIYCGYDTTIDDAREKLRYDLIYVKNSSLKTDIQILLKTLWMIISGKEVVKSSPNHQL